MEGPQESSVVDAAATSFSPALTPFGGAKRTVQGDLSIHFLLKLQQTGVHINVLHLARWGPLQGLWGGYVTTGTNHRSGLFSGAGDFEIWVRGGSVRFVFEPRSESTRARSVTL